MRFENYNLVDGSTNISQFYVNPNKPLIRESEGFVIHSRIRGLSRKVLSARLLASLSFPVFNFRDCMGSREAKNEARCGAAERKKNLTPAPFLYGG